MTAQEVLELIQRAKDKRAGELDLSGRNLTEIPPEIAHLTSLKSLSLSDNQISEIPEALAYLTSLRFLYLNNNQISEIPEALAQLTSLQVLNLNNNDTYCMLENDQTSDIIDRINTKLKQLLKRSHISKQQPTLYKQAGRERPYAGLPVSRMWPSRRAKWRRGPAGIPENAARTTTCSTVRSSGSTRHSRA